VTFPSFRVVAHQPDVFNLLHKTVILSAAPRRYTAHRRVYRAESKELGVACWQMLFGAFRPRTMRKLKSHKLWAKRLRDRGIMVSCNASDFYCLPNNLALMLAALLIRPMYAPRQARSERANHW